ncbi:GNAT family N-acetyltransferase [Paenibacillus cremeus]|uniref:GNAT family N-acetyltransferase n=1 Tax=Paenibacillus cremeus TaxID=2163881 RepID=A0A559KDB5_9BACL|nr:GNAT family N-acyltransferase [Paenibacillus cremeus]TVY10131.1 GNAT family N-acetyltransferase [Paenibacillus cremeus]
MIQTANPITHPHPSLALLLAESTADKEQAMRLRYQVFVEEEKNMQMRTVDGLEQDAYDTFCDHLIVKDLDTDRVVGTYRLLPGERALQNIGFYSESEFDLSEFTMPKTATLELGRSCVDPAYRGGRVIQMLWEGIASYITERGYDYLIGCASVHLRSIEEVNLIYSMLKQKQVITDKYGVKPLQTHRIPGLQQVELDRSEKDIFRLLPPLMKGYQWLGAEIGGDPAYDAVFETVDFFIVLERERVSRRYRRHFLKP